MEPSPAPPLPPPPRGLSCLGCVGILSVLLNFVLVAVLSFTLWPTDDETSTPLSEVHYSGDTSASDKIAVVRIAGVLMEGMTASIHQQIRQAAQDENVKAVVVRIDSPGGTISASEDIYHALTDLRDNTHTRFTGTGAKPLVASMGSVAASGGYYVAMPAGRVYAEPTTITGSIGVFAALPNVSELANAHGVRVEMIRAGNIKAGGSPFQPLRPDERQPWQNLVDHAYDRFLTVVVTGRPQLTKPQLTGEVTTTQVPVYDESGLPRSNKDGSPMTRLHTRYRADGGTYTPPQALSLGLIDEIGDLSAAITHAAQVSGRSSYRVVSYQRKQTYIDMLLAIEASQQSRPLSVADLSNALTPRLWYLAPGFEGSGTISRNPLSAP